MRAVKIRNGVRHLAVDQIHDDDRSAAAAAALEDDAHDNIHHQASTSVTLSATASVAFDSKNATMPPQKSLALHITNNPMMRYSIDSNTRQDDVATAKEAAAMAAIQLELLNDEDSPCVPSSSDPLAEAFARDAPLTFTAREEPRVVARLPLRFHQMLPIIDEQLQYRQRQAAHQDAVDATPSFLPSSTLLASPRGAAARLEGHAAVCDFVRERLPFAVGRVPGCKTKMAHLAATTNAELTAAAAAETILDAQELSVEEEQQIFREHIAEEVLDYLLCPTLPTRCETVVTAEGGKREVREVVQQDSEQQYHHAEDEQRHAVVDACLSGLREVPSDSVEYGEILRRLLKAADARAASSEVHQQQTEADVNAGFEVDVPAYMRQLLIGYGNADGDSSAPAAEPIDSVAAPVVVADRAALSLAGAEPRVPVVTSTLRATLDAVLPPRMLLYYSVQYEAAVEVQQQRRAAQAQQEELRQALHEHSDDRQSQVELEELTALLTEQYPQAPVGVVLLLLERTSDVQTPREYLKALEKSLDEILACCHARCCGKPLKLSTSAENAQRQAPSSLSAAATTTIATPTFTPTRPADAKAKVEKGMLRSRAAAAAAAATTTILSNTKNLVCTRTTRPPPARPAALSSSGGGSASVATTLNVLELNKERRLVQFDLLGEELLRQVTVDLPERGVLLRRLLDEAQLSLEARGVVARERLGATQEHLLDGQDEREALVDARVQLESEAAELRERLAFLRARKAGLEAWVKEREERTAVAEHRRRTFEQELRERLTAHTEAMKAAQDAARQSALA